MTTVPTDSRERELYDLAVRIGLAWRGMRRGSTAVQLREYLYGTGEDAIEHGQMDTLEQLFRQPSWRMSDLAEALRIDPSNVTRAVQRLEKMGFAERRPSTEDGRVVEVRITDAGRARHEDVTDRRAALMTRIVRAYDETELPVLAEMLERFVMAVDEFVADPDPDPDPDPA
jgi:DNA-binding MarR family transcriptional regulator